MAALTWTLRDVLRVSYRTVAARVPVVVVVVVGAVAYIGFSRLFAFDEALAVARGLLLRNRAAKVG